MENAPDINWIDGIITGMLLLSSAWGLFRGLVRGVLGILSLLASFVAAQKYGGALGAAMGALLGESVVSVVLGYVLVFLTGLMVFGIFSYFVRKVLAGADLGGADKFGGLFFGAARGGILGALFVLLLSAFPLQQAASWRESVTVPLIGGALNAALNLSPLRGYAEYLKFDSENRPRLAVAGRIAEAGKNGGEPEQKNMEKGRNAENGVSPPAALKRDDLLDELNDEMARQSLHNDETARQNAEEFKDKHREKSFLQKISPVLEEISDELEKGE